MLDRNRALIMARYNRWQNGSLTAAASEIGQTARRQDRGAFFGSIERTFAHLLWADGTWLARFTDGPMPKGGIAASAADITDWDSFLKDRAAQDAAIIDWAAAVDGDWLAKDMTWFSGALGRELTRPRAVCVLHLFNHQTHHRGQIHAMLTAAGARPDDTDLPLMAEDMAGG
ncbi:MAG: DinB family protein [Paracoccus sp. (in: a-proteobacteria)]|uniref:DinB family protein n=1 Tax=Paracoccus sp. TaxID=267 RepID=UPI0026E11151|nr:DinB family protein [Paracoccus sp. (in: a-proteobacteria)]MDO5632898.1 DinB family protein [Paracoccus sp. (in: a-proteobacteria)]